MAMFNSFLLTFTRGSSRPSSANSSSIAVQVAEGQIHLVTLQEFSHQGLAGSEWIGRRNLWLQSRWLKKHIAISHKFRQIVEIVEGFVSRFLVVKHLNLVSG